MSRAQGLDARSAWRVVRVVAPLVVGWLLVFAGAVVLTVGWIGISAQPLVAQQLPYLLSGGLGGLGLLVVGAALVALHDVRAVGERLSRLEERVDGLHAAVLEVLRTLPPHPSDQAAHVTAGASAAAGTGAVYVLASGERFHAAGCAVLAGKREVQQMAIDEAEGSGLVACRLCAPG